MNFRLKNISKIFSLTVVVLIAALPHFLFAQAAINGKVIYEKDHAPAVGANIELNNKSASAITDETGNFKISIQHPNQSDSITISSVGYESIKIPVSSAIKKPEFKLKEIVKSLNGVTVFNTKQVIGSTSESVGYYRSWNHENTGGEIGRFFYLPYKEFKIDKIRFKAGNLCDTCLLRVHIRKVVDGKPGEEILKDSISMYVNHLSLDTKIPEFDLTPYDFTFTENQFYVGIEVLNCSNGKKGFCAFNFAGTEKGEYVYKSRGTSEWQTTDDYTVYLKLFLRF